MNHINEVIRNKVNTQSFIDEVKNQWKNPKENTLQGLPPTLRKVHYNQSYYN